MKIKLYFSLVLVLAIFNANAQKNNSIKMDSLFIEFKKKSFYENIYPAKRNLENFQKEIIPKLIVLLKDTAFVKLVNTADLIYPGSTTYYGHGEYLPYNIDWISIRSGWLLEDLTFQDFGYKNCEVTDETLIKLAKENYYDYIKIGKYQLDWKNRSSNEKVIEYRRLLSVKVKKWWKENHKQWNRISAITEALKSNNKERLSNVLQYLRFGDSKCDNLTNEIYLKKVKPIILSLKKINEFPEIQEQIELILNESVNLNILDKKETY